MEALINSIVPKFDTVAFQDIDNQIAESKSKGLMGQTIRLTRAKYAIALTSINMRLLHLRYSGGGKFFLYEVREDGEITDNYKYMDSVKLSKFTGNIPDNILNQIPDGAGSKARVLVDARDPIIVIKIKELSSWFSKTGFYAAIWKWD